MSKKVGPIIGLSTFVVLFVSLLIYMAYLKTLDNTRYEIVKDGNRTIELDRRTGQSWGIFGNSKSEIKEKVQRYLTNDELSKVKVGESELLLTTGIIEMEIYNGNALDIDWLTFQVGIKAANNDWVYYKLEASPHLVGTLLGLHFGTVKIALQPSLLKELEGWNLKLISCSTTAP